MRILLKIQHTACYVTSILLILWGLFRVVFGAVEYRTLETTVSGFFYLVLGLIYFFIVAKKIYKKNILIAIATSVLNIISTGFLLLTSVKMFQVVQFNLALVIFITVFSTVLFSNLAFLNSLFSKK